MGTRYQVYPDQPWHVQGRDEEATRGGQWAVFEILHDRPVTAADLAPDALARALSGFFDIKGPNLSGGGIQARLRGALDCTRP